MKISCEVNFPLSPFCRKQKAFLLYVAPEVDHRALRSFGYGTTATVYIMPGNSELVTLLHSMRILGVEFLSNYPFPRN